MDFLDKMKEYIEGLRYTPSKLEVGLQKMDQDSMAIRPVTSAPTDRDLGKGKNIPYSFQILLNHKSSKSAHDILQRLVDELDDAVIDIMGDGSYEINSIYCTGTPSHVESTKYGSLWTAMFEAELYIK